MRLPLLALAILSLIALPQTAGQAAMQQGKKAPWTTTPMDMPK